jgi:hypothetical protein
MDSEPVKSVKLKPVASSHTAARSDIVEVDQANNVEVSHNCDPNLLLAPSEADMSHGTQVNKNFNTLSTLSLAVSLMATWETVCSTIGSGLVSGGSVSLVYGFIRMTFVKMIAGLGLSF